MANSSVRPDLQSGPPNGSTRTASTALGPAVVALVVVSIVGCPPPRGSETPPGSKGTARPAAAPSLCLLDVGQVVAAARKTPFYAAMWKRVEGLKAQAQAAIDAMVKTYRQRFDLDIRAATHLKKHDRLMKEKGVIHPSVWNQRMAALAAELNKDPALKRAVEEQKKNAPAYRKRHLEAQAEAKRIAQEGARLQKELRAKAQKLAAPLADRLKTALESAMKEAVTTKACDVLCNPETGRRLGFSQSGPEKGRVCRKGMREGQDLTDLIRRKVVGVLGTSRTP